VAPNQSVQSASQVYTHVTTHQYTFPVTLLSLHRSTVRNGTWQTRI